jgi:hypothetical protein
VVKRELKTGTLGEDHLLTLTSASNLATDLTRQGEHRATRELDEDMARYRRTLQDGDADG